MNALQRTWYKNHYLHYPLIPFSYIYQGITSTRHLLYQRGIKKTYAFPLPIIVVGNITVGGNGKTPMVIYLVELLKQQGYKPGVVSRGYGGKAKVYPFRVQRDSDPREVGDEPLLIARRTAVPVVVDPNRVQAVKAILAETDCNVIVSDDGLQHYALKRDIEITVVNGNSAYGNGYCLPAGPMRESISRLNQVDFKINLQPTEPDEYQMNIHYKQLVDLNHLDIQVDASYFYHQTVHAVAGIAAPQRFFSALRELGLKIIENPFPDHHQFSATDLNFGKDAVVIMTEKDAVKCAKFEVANCWYLPISADVNEPFNQEFLTKLRELKG